MAPGLWSLLQLLSRKSGLPMDQVNFAFFQISCLILAIVFRTLLHPYKVSPKTRHLFAASFGLYIGWYSYSWSFLHLLTQATVPYIMMRTMNPKVIHKFVLAFAVVYMSAVHISQQLRNINIYKMDHIGPMMVMTEKVTSLAFSLHDGLTREDKDLNKQQKEMRTKKMPSVLEYYSYMFYFQALVVGPVCFYQNYIDFIEGRHLVPYIVKTKDGKEIVVHKEPPVWRAVLGKLAFSVAMVFCFVVVVPKYPLMDNVYNEEVFRSSLLYKFWFLWLSVEVAKSKYFFAWIYADAVNNASGLGFNGYDEKGNAKWNLVTNINVKAFETATSLKVLIDNWNIQTNIWLRYVCYDRVPLQRTFFTFVLSSIWHGFYPGYFWTFISAAFMTAAARKVRHNVRPLFQGSKFMASFYDLVTLVFTHIVLAYSILPFTLLRNDLIIKYFGSFFFSFHFAAILILLFFPTRTAPRKKLSEDGETMKGIQNSLPDGFRQATTSGNVYGDKKRQ